MTRLTDSVGAALRMAWRPVERVMHDQRFVQALERAERAQEAKVELTASMDGLSAALDAVAERIR